MTLKSRLGSLNVVETGVIRKLGYSFLFAFYSNYGISLAVCEIFSIKEWHDVENWVRGRSRSLKMARFVTTLYWSAITSLSCTIFELFGY